LILELTGFGTDHGAHDGSVDHDGAISFDHAAGGFWDHFGFFSVRNMIYFLMMFGWTGLACSKCHFPGILTIMIATISGLLTTIIIGWIFFMFSRLTESGTVNINSAVGQIGSVYISIPEKRSGSGVIQIVLQGATQELNAVTDSEKLPTGKSVQVVEAISGNTVLVIGSDEYAANV